MQRSVAKILTTHVGSLPLLSLSQGVAGGDHAPLADDVAAVVARQREIGIDIINERAATGCATCRTASAALQKFPSPTKSR